MKFKDSILSTEHVLLNILSNDLKNKNILETAGISYDSFYNEINKIRENKKRILTEKQPTKQIKLKTQFLDKNAKNINFLSNERKIDKLYGRKNEIKKLSTILCKRNNNCALIEKNNDCDLQIRKLTPKECWRLMGFDDEDFEKAEKINSNTQLYKQAGNSIVVNVLEEILKNLLF